jgi:hypothetical protein
VSETPLIQEQRFTEKSSDSADAVTAVSQAAVEDNAKAVSDNTASEVSQIPRMPN